MDIGHSLTVVGKHRTNGGFRTGDGDDGGSKFCLGVVSPYHVLVVEGKEGFEGKLSELASALDDNVGGLDIGRYRGLVFADSRAVVDDIYRLDLYVLKLFLKLERCVVNETGGVGVIERIGVGAEEDLYPLLCKDVLSRRFYAGVWYGER